MQNGHLFAHSCHVRERCACQRWSEAPLVLSVRPWELSFLPTTALFRLLERWCEFVAGSNRLGITEDTWRQARSRAVGCATC